MKKTPLTLLTVLAISGLHAQEIDSLETSKKPAKVLHAEPLYVDLIRDLGTRKGEKEWNVGLGLKNNNTFDKYTALVEYE